MDIKLKTCDIRTWKKKHLFLDIPSTNTLVPSLYQCVETGSIEVSWLLPPSLPHLRFNLFVNSETSDIKVVFWLTKQMDVTSGQVRAVKQMFKKFQMYFLNSLRGSSNCIGYSIVMMKQFPSFQMRSMSSANSTPKLRQNFTVRCRIHIFTTLLKMG
jgi:hypothetical protein